MKVLNGLIIAAVAVGIWLVSDSLTNYHLVELEKSGEIPYGPLPEYTTDNYLFNKSSTTLMEKYPLDKIKDLTKENFEDIVLGSLNDQDRVNLRPHLKTILSKSEEYQLDPFWVLSIVMVESRFINHQTSSMNALGLMQIRPETASHVYQMMNRNIDQNKIAENLFKTDENLEVGAFYLKKLLQNFKMNFKNATIAYNVGPNKLKNLIADNETHAEGDLYYYNVSKNYARFAVHFKRELQQMPSILDSTYIVNNRGQKLDEIIVNNLTSFSYIPSTSQNLAAY